MREKVQEISRVFFEKMWIHMESFSVTEQKENAFFIKLITDDSALITSNRWAALHDIQKILCNLLSLHFNMRIFIQVEVNDYLAEKDAQLFNTIDDKIELCLRQNKEIQLPFFSPYERKKIHNYIADKNLENIWTKSEGEWKERRLYICKKSKKMTIDMDWTEI